MKKKKGIVIFIFFLLIGACIGGYFLLFRKDSSSLTLGEKKWIENNKNKMIDVAIQTEIPLYSYQGEGIVMDLLSSFEEKIGLEFSKITDTEDDRMLSFVIKDNVEKNDIVITEDYAVLVTKEESSYAKSDEIDEMTIGVLEGQLDFISQTLNNDQLSFKAYKTEDEILKALSSENEQIGGAVVSKTRNLDEILSQNLFISYSIIDKKEYYVLDLSDDSNFNSIFKKFYEEWYQEEYEERFQSHFISLYDKIKNVTDKEKSALKSKTYVYGFIEDIPYNSLSNKELIGANYYLIRDFYKLTGIEINYKKYENIKELKKDFENGKVDFIFNNTNTEKGYQTISVYDNEGVIVSSDSNIIGATSLNGVQNEEIMVLKNSHIEQVLKEKNIKYKSYDSMEKMMKKVKDNSILALDYYEFLYYQKNELKDFRVDFTFKINSYGYAINEETTSETFRELFNFYLSYANRKNIVEQGILDYQQTKMNVDWLKQIMINILALFGIYSIVKGILQKIIVPKEKKAKLGKEDKIKYIDQLTSLKNRTYLNDKLKEWEKSAVYPQTIIIVDLNNVSYINDNFGHEEGDSIICKAANILIQNQMVNSEIIRTSGNEFLIYLVGFEEKQIITYIKKLTKELKELPHGFGAAIGYSMIKDEIKTIDDAINESTLDMKTNKEESKKS